MANKMEKRKIHKSYYSFGSYSLCGRIAYSPEHIKLDNNWKGVNCEECVEGNGIRIEILKEVLEMIDKFQCTAQDNAIWFKEELKRRIEG